MTAYILFIREGAVHDPAEMAQYATKARALPPHPCLKSLGISGAPQALEGTAPENIVLLQFPSVAEANNWYHSPGYQAAAVHRKLGADYRVMIIEGL